MQVSISGEFGMRKDVVEHIDCMMALTWFAVGRNVKRKSSTADQQCNVLGFIASKYVFCDVLG